MITENISTLKIHRLTQEQYDRELAAGNIDKNAIYLTPDENSASFIVDSELSDVSANPVENRVITRAINKKSETHITSDFTNMVSEFIASINNNE